MFFLALRAGRAMGCLLGLPAYVCIIHHTFLQVNLVGQLTFPRERFVGEVY